MRSEQFAVVFANEHLANFASVYQFVVLLLPKSKERTRAPARFPVLKGPIRRQTMRAKQAGHFPLFNCPTLSVRNIRESKTKGVENGLV
jgi:hypothetical protein